MLVFVEERESGLVFAALMFEAPPPVGRALLAQ
jgi:hypothetical protein